MESLGQAMGPKSDSHGGACCRTFMYQAGRKSAAKGTITVRLLRVSLAAAAIAFNCPSALAQQPAADKEATEDDALTKLEKSPWLLAPLLQSNPKLGTSVGALAGYVHYFDEKSRPSIFAVLGQYTSTDSIIAGVQARTSFDEDRQRLIAGMIYGYIKNDYSDYLGTGVALRSNSEVKGMIARYTHRVRGNWFLGVQGLYQNFGIGGETAFDDVVLDVLGVAPYKSGGLGLVAQYDSRDNENSLPQAGWPLLTTWRTGNRWVARMTST